MAADLLLAAEHPWALRIDRQNIQAYTRKVDGSSILEFKGHMVIDAPLADILPVFEDVSTTSKWFYNCVESKLIADEALDQKLVYIVLRLPWPVSERDCVFRINKSVDASTGTVTYAVVALPDKLPVRRDRIRVPYLKASWHFVPLSGGRTEIDFQQHSDPGGFIPDFISNSLVVDIPYNSFKDLSKLIMSLRKKG
jgi:hypothetical protein